jgi:hypothetical protein
MKRILLFSLTCLPGWLLFVGCSSSSSGGGGIPCDDAGACPNGYQCQAGQCIQVSGTGGAAQGGSGGGQQGGSGGIPSGGGGPSGGSGGISGSGGVPPVGGGGGPSGGGTGGSGTCGGLTFVEPACQSCMEGNCCSEVLACDVGSDCYLLLGCLQQNCATAPDVQVCAEQYCSAYANGVTNYNAVNQCAMDYCPSECGAGGG